MKKLIISFVLVLILLFGSCMYNYSISKATNELYTLTLQIKENPTKEKVNQLEEVWKKNSTIFEIGTDHSELDKIRISIADLNSAFEKQDYTLLNMYAEELKEMFSHIKQRDKLSLGNIL